MHEYLTDGAEIYRRSFAMIRAESDLSRFPGSTENVAVRMIHASGQTDLAADIEISAGAVGAGRSALAAGAPILCDVRMVEHGVTRSRLPADNDVRCLLGDPRVTELAARSGTTRTAAAVELWGDALDGAVVAIANAPTALFHLLDLLAAGAPRPAVIVGAPVGFVGAAESKDALRRDAVRLGIEYVTVRGRRGGSAICAAALNALAQEEEL
ncbi:precorrin-8X methylmutase [Tsukamurella sp. 8F]|uniref:precorrin-8X methylmutase n=1 Tax=unclassified Tsukamurella TaxID=2633480 RepID=UPI0023B9541C|nr:MULTISPECIES: precorrin-8X methylmutase [unclassified Tsukamurella]MDF0530571.1 precorrin-8X methylmutase [Tsukamurella sp. 8J]MDF0586779.1 precorrin-8X methylmutase [Tsukamurella sp. 8F]